MNYSVVVPFDVNSSFAYFSDQELAEGQLVAVDFRRKETVGVIFGKDREYKGELKKITTVLPYQISSEYVDFIKFISTYNMNAIGNVMRLIVPFSIDKILIEEKEIKPIAIDKNLKKIILNNQQSNALSKLEPFKNQFRTTLLHGVTGSGKTEVFLEFAKGALQVLILVPEIALSNELAKKVASKLCIPVYIWHNSVSPAKKRDIWKKAINGEKLAIVGARSSLFIPFSNLECIIVDEEHDGSFKQAEGITYNARDMAIYLANLKKIPIVLSSATPSLESYQNALNGKYEYIKLENKFFENTLPNIVIDDLRQSKQIGILSKISISMIRRCLENRQQALVFVNRRGHTPKILCSSCGWKVQCPNCDTWLCYHSKGHYLACHYCGYKSKPILKCQACGENTLIGIGSGVEKAAEEISSIFPEANIMSLSSDNMSSPSKISKLLGQIQNNEVSIIVGTQILAKGHNFPRLNTVIVTCLDSMLYGDDFRTTEKAFQTIHQVIGRAGRFKESGEASIVFQTYNPEDPLIQLISKNDVLPFYNIEIKNRELALMPPFSKMVSVNISSSSELALQEFGKSLICAAPRSKNLTLIGPVLPEIPKINNIYRMRIILIAKIQLQRYVDSWLKSVKEPNNIKLCVDIDPYDFF